MSNPRVAHPPWSGVCPVVQAHMWLTFAAVQGYQKEQEGMDGAARKMTPDQIAEAKRLACERMAKHQQ